MQVAFAIIGYIIVISTFIQHNSVNEFIKFLIIISMSHIFLHFCKPVPERIQWYFVHFIINMLICYNALDDIIIMLQDPLKELFGPTYSYKTTLQALYLHLYHVMLYTLDKHDIEHHVIYGMGGYICIIYVNLGRLLSLYHLFVTGLPGGICYLMSYLNNIELLNKKMQLYLDASINRWIRCVGLNICGTLILIKFTYSEHAINDVIFVLFGSIATFYNGIYYAKISTEKYVKENVIALNM